MRQRKYSTFEVCLEEFDLYSARVPRDFNFFSGTSLRMSFSKAMVEFFHMNPKQQKREERQKLFPLSLSFSLDSTVSM